MRLKLKPLAEQVVVITGASSGIGLATARAASARGASVVLVARNEEVLQQVRREIEAAGGRADAVAADVGDPDQVEAVVAAAEVRFGGFDTWVNDAGVGIYGELEKVAFADHERLFRTNYFGVVNGTLAAVRHLRARGEPGAVINVGSVLSDVGSPMLGAYAASKHAVKGFTESLRMELIREKAPVSLSLIKPSSISTPFPEHMKNLTDATPQVPPVRYAPEVVADAILHAATHPVRQMTVGFGSRPMVLTTAAAPPIADRLFARLIPPLSRRRGRDWPDDGLRSPTYDGHTETPAYRGRRFSLYTEVQKHPMLALGAGLALAGAAMWLPLRGRRQIFTTS
ncbi:SDR family oxidoreductase [Phenylobacterium sp.]|uniref:SDR family oxidoreductase n=1 Tax=Phenylobacterium sp. TaxID=1871053 RepID=UPI0035B1F0E8